jgi:hypothetical protein
MRIRLTVACLLGALTFASIPGGSMIEPREAHAATAIAYTLEELVDQSSWAIVAVALERESLWERVAGGKRIVTYTKLEIDTTIYGDALTKEKSKTVWVRTLGGAVGKIGQSVAGEARFKLGAKSVLFLAKAVSGALVVSGASQGHYPVRVPPNDDGDDTSKRKAVLRFSPSMGKIVPRHGPSITVQETLIGNVLKKAIAKIQATKAKRDALRDEK